MNTLKYVEVVPKIFEGTLPLEKFVSLLGIDYDLVQRELSQRARLVGYAFGDNRLPIYFFDGHRCPTAALLMHTSKLYAFARIGSAYATPEMSSYDTREVNPYTQVGVYDPSRRLFVAGLRFLPLSSVPYEQSSMSALFVARPALQSYFPQTLELGTTFVIPDVQRSLAATHYLLSALAFAIEANKPTYLIGRPTIPGVFNRGLKEVISSWFCEEFPLRNSFLNPEGISFIDYLPDVPPLSLRPFSKFVEWYGGDYQQGFSMRQKINIVSRMVEFLEVKFPPVIAFYAAITASSDATTISPGMIVLGQPVENSTYISKSWEIPIWMFVEKIAPGYVRYFHHAKASLESID